ncbi:hypothetical protein [Propylenella binzhouense]|uniref:Uncharacterized protein n=1 Tax=Propylenella binzhouense TaxID=2555902 RepID=A0A964T704_9HYPH|nr:hypothetical protein [Propylenella binzhouense]MYZ48567.1 hypothetical protein [Propylenella binzhouense]
MDGIPETAEILATVARLEGAFEEHPDPAVRRLYGLYLKVCKQFEDDLGNARDRALSRAAVLMLIRLQEEGAGDGTAA